jgi:hypothetical protein
MTRMATVDMDAPQDPPAAWNGDWVCSRLVEAYRIEARLPGVAKYFSNGSAWPSINYEFADVVAQGETASSRVLAEWENTRGGVFAYQLTRMDQAHDWLRHYLAGHEVERMCLAHWATSMAYHRSLQSLLRKRRWSRTTFYRRVSAGASIIAGKLIADRVPIA